MGGVTVLINSLIQLDKNVRIGVLFAGFALFIILMPFFGELWFISLLLSFTFLAILIISNGVYARKFSNHIEASLGSVFSQNEFSPDDSYLSDDYLTGIAINESQNKIALLYRRNVNEDFTFSKVSFNEVLECSIAEDEEVVTKVSKGLAAGGLLVGGVTGGILGGVLGDKNSKTKIYKASLSLTLDNISSPTFTVNFLNSKMLVDKNSDLYQRIHQEMFKWNQRMAVIIKRNEPNSNPTQRSV